MTHTRSQYSYTYKDLRLERRYKSCLKNLCLPEKIKCTFLVSTGFLRRKHINLNVPVRIAAQ